MEHLLLYVWKHKLFPDEKLQTTAGLPVEVIDSGVHEANNGSLFSNARIKIGDTLWAGDVEILPRSSDWLRRGHDSGGNGSPVILLAASETDCEIKRTDGRAISQIRLACPDHIRQQYEELKKSTCMPRCRQILGKLPPITVHSWLSALQNERFGQKAAAAFVRLEQCRGNWEDAFFVTLARNFGFGFNGDAFEQWSARLPFRVLGKYRDNLMQIEAFFFGTAGLLEEIPDEPYSRDLQKEYAYFRKVFGLEQMEAEAWNHRQQRPGSFPHLRIAWLAWLYHNRYNLFSQITEAETLRCAKNLLRSQTSEYWETHHLFGKTSPRRKKPVGEAALNLILINTVVTFLFAYGKYVRNDRLCERGQVFLEELKPENNHITRMWGRAGIRAVHAADSQALIQLKKEYCDRRRCLHCRIGFEYLKNQKQP